MIEMTDYLKQLHMSSIRRCYEKVAEIGRAHV